MTSQCYLPVESRNGNKLAALFTDEFTRYRQVWCAPTSASVHVTLEQYCNTCEDRGYKLEVVRCDSEWVTEKAKALARKKGFVFQVSAPYCQWQDGVAERYMRTWGDKVRCVRTMAEAHKLAKALAKATTTSPLPKPRG